MTLDRTYDQLAFEEDYEPLNDYEDQMDGVRLGLVDYDDVHCKHGTFIGNSWGPDYMCGYCEMGVPDEEYLAGVAAAERRARRIKALTPKLGELLVAVDAAAAIDPESDESKRLFKRVVKYIFWHVQPPKGMEGYR